jgi:hypothetical protein
MNKEEIIKEVISILETSDYVDPVEHLYDGLKQINREITYTTIHDFLWALESSTVIDVDGKIAECAKKIKQLLQQELLDEVYKEYRKQMTLSVNNGYDINRDYFKSNENGFTPYTQEEFINKCKTNTEFAKKWGLTIEERELSRNERSEYYYKHGNSEGIVEGSLDRPMFKPIDVAHKWYNERNVPTKLITIKYNDQTIESYE